MAAAAIGGLALGWVVVGLERALLTPPPIELGSVENLRMLLTGLVGGLITVAVFSLWMRTVVVGLLSDQFSPRVLVTFLDDGFQRTLLATISGGLVAVVVILLNLPTAQDAPAPLAGAAAAVVIALAALAAVFAAIQHAIATLSPRELVSRLADHALSVLDRQPTSRAPASRLSPRGDALAMWGHGTGWVTKLDASALLAALPAGSSLFLHIRVGDFVTASTHIATLSLGDRRDDFDADALRRAIQLSRTRDPDRDLAFAIGHLTDVAVHALTGGSKDTATAHEALQYLGAVLERVVEHGETADHRIDDQERRLVDDAAWRPADHVEMVSKRLRIPASHEPDSALQLVDMLGKVRMAAEAAGDRHTIREVGRQVEALLALADRRDMLLHDRQSLARTADAALSGQTMQ